MAKVKLLIFLLKFSTALIEYSNGEFREKNNTDPKSLRLYYGRFWKFASSEESNDTGEKEDGKEESEEKPKKDPTKLLRWDEPEQREFNKWLQMVKNKGVECPADYPFAFKNGTDCCFSKLEDKDSSDTKDSNEKFRNLCDGKSLFWTSPCCMNNHTASVSTNTAGRVISVSFYFYVTFVLLVQTIDL